MVSARDSVAATTVRTRKEGAADAPKHRDYRHYKDVIVRLEIIQKARFIRAAKRDCLPCGINLAGVGISRDQKRATTVRYAIGDEVSPLRTAPPAPHDREFESFPPRAVDSDSAFADRA
jgi:hypothetical protein